MSESTPRNNPQVTEYTFAFMTDSKLTASLLCRFPPYKSAHLVYADSNNAVPDNSCATPALGDGPLPMPDLWNIESRWRYIAASSHEHFASSIVRSLRRYVPNLPSWRILVALSHHTARALGLVPSVPLLAWLREDESADPGGKSRLHNVFFQFQLACCYLRFDVADGLTNRCCYLRFDVAFLNAARDLPLQSSNSAIAL